MARQNYRQGKQQRERAKKIKRDKKEQRRAARTQPQGTSEPAADGTGSAPPDEVVEATVQDRPATVGE